MSKQNKKPVKYGEKKENSLLNQDLEVFTGLPPQVDGQIRCFCKLSIPQVIWTIPRPPIKTLVRVKWWGETGKGVIFRPHDVKRGQRAESLTNTARYAVRSGPCQFATYLKDMGILKLDVLTSPELDIIGQAQVPKLGLLTTSKPINGFLPVISTVGEKLAKLQVALVLEPTYGSQGDEDMIPTTDSGLGEKLGSPQNSVLLAHPTSETGHVASEFGSLETQQNTDSRPLFQQMKESIPEQVNGLAPSRDLPISGQPQGKDLLSVIVDRGMKLRQAMVVSSMPENNNNRLHGSSHYLPPNGPTDLAYSPGSVSNATSSPIKDMEFQVPWPPLLDRSPGDSSYSSEVAFDPAILGMLGDPMGDNSLIQDLFFQQIGQESHFSQLEGTSKPNQLLSEPARLLGGSVEGQREVQTRQRDPKEDSGNKRPPSRSSSLASLHLADQDLSTEQKAPKRKARSRSRSKSGARSRSRSSSTVRSQSQSNTPRNPAMMRGKIPSPRDNIASTLRIGANASNNSSNDISKRKPKKKKPRSRSSSRSRSTSRSRSRRRKGKENVSESMEFDQASTVRSNASDFASTPTRMADKQACLNSEKLHQLSRVHVVSLHIRNLKLNKADVADALQKTKIQSQSSHKLCTYVIEFQLPTSGIPVNDKSAEGASAEYVTITSQRIQDEAVIFNHKSFHPIVFDPNTIEKWWKSALVFRLYCKEGKGSAILIGSGGMSLKSILRSEDLEVLREIEIPDTRKRNALNSSRTSSLNTSGAMVSNLFGLLQVSLQLANGKAQTENMEQFNQPLVKAPSKKIDFSMASKPAMVVGLPPQSPRGPKAVYQDKNLPDSAGQDLKEMLISASTDGAETIQLHALLLIQEGYNVGFSMSHGVGNRGQICDQTCNTYVVCKMLWCKDSMHSNVCWGTQNPAFNFLQVTPVLLTSPLLERMKDNYVIVEVWDRKVNTSSDKLLGMVKLSVQQFFLSFREKKIAKALLSSEFPVVAIDNQMPIVDPFTGIHVGQLKVLLAMGSASQVSNLRRVTNGLMSIPSSQSKVPPNTGEHAFTSQNTGLAGTENHEFELRIEDIKGLTLSDNMLWGEADCYVQFFFPTQDGDSLGKSGSAKGFASLKCYRTATTLCMPDPKFSDISVHKLVLPIGVPVQRELLTACTGSNGCPPGLGFEVWCRHYHPNIRDQLIAKSFLPLAKLSAMVTMHKPGESCVQPFSLKLSQVGGDSSNGRRAQTSSVGMLSFTITYRNSVQSHYSIGEGNIESDASHVCLSVGVLRACGLKSAAESVAYLDPSMQYPAETGVNAYVRMLINVLGRESVKVTKTVAKSFSPEFSWFMDMSCPLVLPVGQSCPARSLAELLESGVATFEVWHQVTPGSDYRDGYHKQTQSVGGDVLLGSCIVPLTSLLSRRTGLNGWFPIILPSVNWERQADGSDLGSESLLDQVIGGLELSIKFENQDDRDRVITAARDLGWSTFDPTWLEESGRPDVQAKDHHVAIAIDHVSFPADIVMTRGLTKLEASTKSYARYKFFDKGAVLTKSKKLESSDSSLVVSNLHHKQEFCLPCSAPLQWYLREERLEVQVWLDFEHAKHQSKHKTRHRDRWLGSCFIDLESLAEARHGRQKISGLFPLFKPGMDSLKSAFVKAELVSRLSSRDVKPQNISLEESECATESERSMEDVELWARKFTVDKSPCKGSESMTGGDSSFAVLMAIERAMHLPLVTERNRSSEVRPSVYVSYQSAEHVKPSVTPVVMASCSPSWDYVVETRLSSKLLNDPCKNLVLKVWHKPADASKKPDKSCDRVLGFVSVDLSPLSRGLQQICGWYNILDFTGQCRGQIKVSITPQDLQGASGPSVSNFGLSNLSFHQPAVTPASQPGNVAEQLQSLQQRLQSWLTRQTAKMMADEVTDSTQTVPHGENVVQEKPKPSLPAGFLTAQAPQLDPKVGTSDETAKSFLLSSLRRQLDDLDQMTKQMKMRLVPTSAASSTEPASGTCSGLSTMEQASSLGDTGPPRSLIGERAAITTGDGPGNNAGARRLFLDSGVFEANNFSDRSEGAGPDSQRSLGTGEAERAEVTSTLPEAITPRSLNGLAGEDNQKTQAFVPAPGAGSEASGSSSGGFMPASQHSAAACVVKPENGSSADDVSTLVGSKQSQAGDTPRADLDRLHTADVNNYGNGFEPDVSDDEDDEDKEHGSSRYGSYHRYRDMLDAEEEDDKDALGVDGETGDVVVVEEIVPRSLNNMSTVLALHGGPVADFSETDRMAEGPSVWQNCHDGSSNSSRRSSQIVINEEDSFFREGSGPMSSNRVESWLDSHTLDQPDAADKVFPRAGSSDEREIEEENEGENNELEHECPVPSIEKEADISQGNQSIEELFLNKREVDEEWNLSIDLSAWGDNATTEVDNAADIPVDRSGDRVDTSADLAKGNDDDDDDERVNHLVKMDSNDIVGDMDDLTHQFVDMHLTSAAEPSALQNGHINEDENEQLPYLSNVEFLDSVASRDAIETLNSLAGSLNTKLERLNPDVEQNNGDIVQDDSFSDQEHVSDPTQTEVFHRSCDVGEHGNHVAELSPPDSPTSSGKMDEAGASGHQHIQYDTSAAAAVDSTADSAFIEGEPSVGSRTDLTHDDSGLGRQVSHNSNGPVLKNFFMAESDMQASLRALKAQAMAANEDGKSKQKHQRARNKALAASQLVSKLVEQKPTSSSAISVKNKKPPSAAEAKRIAKIFTSRHS